MSAILLNINRLALFQNKALSSENRQHEDLGYLNNYPEIRESCVLCTCKQRNCFEVSKNGPIYKHQYESAFIVTIYFELKTNPRGTRNKCA